MGKLKKKAKKKEKKALKKAKKKVKKKVKKVEKRAVAKRSGRRARRPFKASVFRPVFRRAHDKIMKIFSNIKVVKLPKQATNPVLAAKAAKPPTNGKAAPLTANGVRDIIRSEISAHFQKDHVGATQTSLNAAKAKRVASRMKRQMKKATRLF